MLLYIVDVLFRVLVFSVFYFYLIAVLLLCVMFLENKIVTTTAIKTYLTILGVELFKTWCSPATVAR